MDFEFSEDREYFDRCFTCWGGLDSRMDLFDFRDPELKRKEFDKIRNKVFEELFGEDGLKVNSPKHTNVINYFDKKK